MPYYSPLRYPGGKRKLTNFIKRVLVDNALTGGVYIEPYAGGASIALALLYDDFVSRIYINDLDNGVYAFWLSTLINTDALCRLIFDTAVTMEEWEHQRSIYLDPAADALARGFATFYLNRTNRSGIVSAGVIGGREQTGQWKIDARYNKQELVARICKVAKYADRITLSNQNAVDLLRGDTANLPTNGLIYLDPPYYVQGNQKLYTTYYKSKDHKEIAQLVRRLTHHWIVSYDNVPDIRALYEGYNSLTYALHYSVQARYQGSEIMFFSPHLNIECKENPVQLKAVHLPKHRGMQQSLLDPTQA